MADLYNRAPSWTDYLPAEWQSAINRSPVINALSGYINRRPSDIEGASNKIFGQPGDREAQDRNWLLQQARGPSALERMNPVAQDGVNKLGILANFFGPGAKLPRVGSPQSRFSGLPDHLAAPPVHDQWDQLLSRIPTTQTKVDGFNLLRDPSWDRVHYSLVPDGVTSRWNPDGSGVPLIGRFQVKPSQNGGIEVTNAFIEQPYTGKGLGQKVYDAIASDFQGTPVIPSSWNQLSPHAVSFWSKRDPEMLARIRDIQRASWEGDRFPDRMIQPAAPKPTGIRAYHGSPHDFDKFDISKIGTGEGAQAYGRGLYFAESEGVAKSYRDNLSADRAWKDKAIRDAEPRLAKALVERGYPEDLAASVAQTVRLEHVMNTPEASLARLYGNKGAEFNRALADAWAVKNEVLGGPIGRMYEVNIKADPDQFLDFDAPLSKQTEPVKKALERAYSDVQNIYGEPVWQSKVQDDAAGHQLLASVAGTHAVDKQAQANKLRDAGIPGIKYLDQGSRAAGQGSRNYVVFDDKLIEILRKYGLLPPVAAGTAAALNQQEPPL